MIGANVWRRGSGVPDRTPTPWGFHAMKTFKTALAVITAALVAMALLASPASAVLGVDDKSVSGSLNPWNTATNTPISPAPTSFETGESIRLQANLPNASAGRSVKLYKVGSATAVATATANSSGNAYFNYTVAAGDQNLFAEDSADLETETDTYTGTDPLPQTGVLNNPTNSGKNWTAKFTEGVAGKETKLQIQRIWTKETDEVNEAPGTPEKGPWVTIATANQTAAGDVTFPAVSSPYPYRVNHKYRAVAGASTSNVVEFGLGQVGAKNTGLAAVYYNTNEGHAVDTRTRYFEGTFAMKAGAAGCGNVGYTDGTQTDKPLKESVMKGRGNYSWSFKRKSYTLKLGKVTDLCGMGNSKKYALVSQDYDKSFLRNALAQFVGKKFNNIEWTPDSKPVDFYLNGKYLGNYLLVERIAIEGPKTNDPADPPEKQRAPRLDLDELNGDDPAEQVSPGITGGYVLEWDFRKGADYNVNLGSDSGYVGVKEPENDLDREGDPTGKGISGAQKTYISGYLNSADNAMRRDSCQSSDYLNFIDKDSAVDYYIAMEYMKPVDGNMWASVYMYKPRGEKLHFGPLWDFDLAAGSATRAGNVASSSGFYLKNNLGISAQQSSNTWFNCLNKRKSFRDAVEARWNEVQGPMNVGGFIDTQKAIIKSSAETSFSNAPNGASHGYRISDYQVIKSNFDADVSYLRSWATGRKSWLNSSSGF